MTFTPVKREVVSQGASSQVVAPSIKSQTQTPKLPLGDRKVTLHGQTRPILSRFLWSLFKGGAGHI